MPDIPEACEHPIHASSELTTHRAVGIGDLDALVRAIETGNNLPMTLASPAGDRFAGGARRAQTAPVHRPRPLGRHAAAPRARPVRYDFACPGGHRFTLEFRQDADLLRQPCGSCRQAAKRVFNSFNHFMTFRAGWNTAVDENFESERAYRTYLDENDLVADR